MHAPTPPSPQRPTPTETPEARVHAPHRFPPMGNTYVVGIATATLTDRESIEVYLDALAAGRQVSELEQRIAVGLDRANTSFFRFELDVVGEADEPRLVDLPHQLDELGLSRDRSTRKLVSILPTRSVGGAEILFPGIGRSEPLQVGVAVMYPAYLEPVVDPGEGERVPCIVTHALGRAFR